MFHRSELRAASSSVAFVGVFLAAISLRYGEVPGPVSWSTLALLTCVTAAIKVIVFAHRGIYRIRVRHLAFTDLFEIGRAVTFSSLLVVAAAFLLGIDQPLSRGVWLLDWGGTLIAVSGVAAVRRSLADHHRIRRTRQRHGDGRVPVLIAGAGHAAEGLLHAIRQDEHSKYHVVGFLGETRKTTGITISGLPVLGTLSEIDEITSSRGISEVVISAGDLPGRDVRELINASCDANIKVTVLPSFEKLLSGEVSLRPREVQIEDLLGRDPVVLDAEKIGHWLHDRTVLVTGSSGSIGSEVCRQLVPFRPKRIVLVDQSESGQFFLDRELQTLIEENGCETDLVVRIADIADSVRMSSIFRDERPEVLFHAAAYKHVPLMESNPGEAVKVNVQGTRLLADLAHQHQLESFVMVSTDKAVNPTSLMGATKRVAELYVQGLSERSSTRFVTVRFGNVLGSAGSVVPIFKQQIEKGGPVTVTHPDMVRFFMTIPEAAQLIVQAGFQGVGGDVFVLDMGQPVKIVDLAKDLIRLSGLTVGEDIEIKFSGTRPGEKLYEELYLEGEDRVPTAHPKILAASSERVPMTQLRASINALADVAEAPISEIEPIIAGLVPTFRKLAAPALEEVRKAA